MDSSRLHSTASTVDAFPKLNMLATFPRAGAYHPTFVYKFSTYDEYLHTDATQHVVLVACQNASPSTVLRSCWPYLR